MNSRENNDYVTKPFVKWVGGKRQIIKSLLPLVPKSYNKYLEPFVGGGALFFSLQPKKAIINDINSELILSYETIKNNYIELINKLNEYSKKHSEEFYYVKRNENPKTEINIVAKFMYLNKSCYNGLYRVNSKGEFNVPFNKSKKVNIYDQKNIENISSLLNNNDIEILNKDFIEVLNMANENDFIFCDPPYDTDTNQFTSYSKKSFGKNEQLILANKLKELNSKNVKWILTNHDTDYIKDLYKEFNIKIIKVNRSINSNGLMRKNSSNEVIITNYKVGAL